MSIVDVSELIERAYQKVSDFEKLVAESAERNVDVVWSDTDDEGSGYLHGPASIPVGDEIVADAKAIIALIWDILAELRPSITGAVATDPPCWSSQVQAAVVEDRLKYATPTRRAAVEAFQAYARQDMAFCTRLAQLILISGDEDRHMAWLGGVSGTPSVSDPKAKQLAFVFVS